MKHIVSIIAITGLLLANSSLAQESVATAKDEVVKVDESKAVSSGEKTEAASTNALPPLDLKVAKIFSNGNLYASMISINTGEELIGLTVPARYGTKASEDGRDIVVFLDSDRRNWVKFKFLPATYTEFTHAALWPTISHSFGNANPVFSTSYVAGRTILGFTAETGTVNNLRQQRVQLIPCKGGTLSASTTTFGAEASLVFFKLKQLVASLQFGSSEKELKHAEPIFED